MAHVNFKTQERTLKDSAYFSRDVITSNGTVLDSVLSLPAAWVPMWRE